MSVNVYPAVTACQSHPCSVLSLDIQDVKGNHVACVTRLNRTRPNSLTPSPLAFPLTPWPARSVPGPLGFGNGMCPAWPHLGGEHLTISTPPLHPSPGPALPQGSLPGPFPHFPTIVFMCCFIFHLCCLPGLWVRACHLQGDKKNIWTQSPDLLPANVFVRGRGQGGCTSGPHPVSPTPLALFQRPVICKTVYFHPLFSLQTTDQEV